MKKILLPVILALTISCHHDKKVSAADKNTSIDASSSNEETVPGDADNPILGKWRVVDATFSDMSEQERKNVIGKASLEFFRGDRVISDAQGSIDTALYLFDKTSRKLKVTSANDTQEFTVEWIEGKMKMTNEEGWALLEKTSN